MTSGNVRIVSKGLRIALAMPSTAEPIRYAAQPWIETLSHNAFAIQSASRLRAHAMRRRAANGTERV